MASSDISSKSNFYRKATTQNVWQDIFESLIDKISGGIGFVYSPEMSNGSSIYNAEAAIDSIQQYSGRDCLEISGIPILPLDSPANLTQEMGQLIGVTIEKQDISITH